MIPYPCQENRPAFSVILLYRQIGLERLSVEKHIQLSFTQSNSVYHDATIYDLEGSKVETL